MGPLQRNRSGPKFASGEKCPGKEKQSFPSLSWKIRAQEHLRSFGSPKHAGAQVPEAYSAAFCHLCFSVDTFVWGKL